MVALSVAKGIGLKEAEETVEKYTQSLVPRENSSVNRINNFEKYK
jgi:hypothetical protein